MKGRIDLLLKKYDECAKSFEIHKETINVCVNTPLRDLGLYGIDKDIQQFHVNTFQEIGWPDPFPNPINIYKNKFRKLP